MTFQFFTCRFSMKQAFIEQKLRMIAERFFGGGSMRQSRLGRAQS